GQPGLPGAMRGRRLPRAHPLRSIPSRSNRPWRRRRILHSSTPPYPPAAGARNLSRTRPCRGSALPASSRRCG
uniref:Uncharacterized protein n=1 Tax=Aegilops tauschii subsp. strangulata TaxID=200361 RepID=A0A452XT86_AEGTS